MQGLKFAVTTIVCVQMTVSAHPFLPSFLLPATRPVSLAPWAASDRHCLILSPALPPDPEKGRECLAQAGRPGTPARTL